MVTDMKSVLKKLYSVAVIALAAAMLVVSLPLTGIAAPHTVYMKEDEKGHNLYVRDGFDEGFRMTDNKAVILKDEPITLAPQYPDGGYARGKEYKITNQKDAKGTATSGILLQDTSKESKFVAKKTGSANVWFATYVNAMARAKTAVKVYEQKDLKISQSKVTLYKNWANKSGTAALSLMP